MNSIESFSSIYYQIRNLKQTIEIAKRVRKVVPNNFPLNSNFNSLYFFNKQDIPTFKHRYSTAIIKSIVFLAIQL